MREAGMTSPKTEVVPRMGGLDSEKLKPAAKPIEERLQKLVDTTLYAGGLRRHNGSGTS
jgi:hypothetical protein